MGLFDFGMGALAGGLRGQPDIPPLDRLDLATEQQKAIDANAAALPGLKKQASDIASFNLDQLNRIFESNIPLFAEMKDTLSGQTLKMAKGELPLSDVQQSELRSVAKSFGGGFAGSPAGGNLVARDLGLRQLDVIGKGLSSAESWMRTAASLYGPAFQNATDLFSRMFISPAQQYAVDNEQNLQQFNYKMGKNIADWKSSPSYLWANELEEAGADVNQMGKSVVSSYLGGMAGRGFGGLGGGGGGSAAQQAADNEAFDSGFWNTYHTTV